MPYTVTDTATSETSTGLALVVARLSIPVQVLSEYERQAGATGLRLEDVLAARLQTAVDYTASKPLYFSDSDCQALEKILGKNVLHTADALIQVRNAMSVRVQKVIITLSVGLLAKLKSRCIGMEWESFLKQTVTQQLERYVGMR